MRHRFLLLPVALMFACSDTGDKGGDSAADAGDGSETGQPDGSDTGDTDDPADTGDTEPDDDPDPPDDTGPVDTGDVDADGDGFTLADGDCNDGDVAVFPGADETCNGIDDNCDDEIDNNPIDGVPAYVDADGDTFGDPDSPTRVCGPTPGFSADPSDCDDSDATRYLGAPELCDDIDNDCDGTVDEDAPGTASWYPDTDGDGYGDPATSVEDCERPEGMVLDGTDCDDTTTDVYPGAIEFCDTLDNDCDGEIDTDSAFGLVLFYADSDGDGYGDASSTAEACFAPSGYVSDATDCDDAEPARYPDAEEICDGIDNDCDGFVDLDDPGGVFETLWYVDSDGDGYGDDDAYTESCEAPSGHVAVPGDCDDASADVHPGLSEVYCDGIDNDCDGRVDYDDDGSGTELPWYRDADGDGYGDDGDVVESCDPPSGYVAEPGDCDDGTELAHPGLAEIDCDGIDNDCDGEVVCVGSCGDGWLGDEEEYDPPPGPWETITVDTETCRWDLSDVRQLYCNGSCSWAGERGCDQPDADLLCKMMLDHPDAIAEGYSEGAASDDPGYACSIDGYGEYLDVRDRGEIAVMHFEDGPLSASHGAGTVVHDPDCVIP